MPLSKNLNTYYDVSQVLVTLRKIGGGYYELASHGAAVMWRSRAYYYRTLLAKADRERLGNVPGYVAETPWDDMYITIEDTKVKVEFGRLKGVVTSLSGEPTAPVTELPKRELRPIQPASDIDLDDLEAEAAKLAEKIDK